ncbi:hypothetical protein HY468_02735 [Candidatus Roizmanbacteria bacterium]|nr:hypothetical protein [Candidatus Roizmanbacteria bacterium]
MNFTYWVQPTPTPSPVLGIASMNGFILDEKGSVVAYHQTEQLPLIQASIPPLTIGDRIESEELLVTIAVLRKLQEEGIAAVEARIYNATYMELTMEHDVHILFNTTNDPVLLSSSLQTMLSVFTIEGRFPKEIDFRFSKPVIRYY